MLIILIISVKLPAMSTMLWTSLATHELWYPEDVQMHLVPNFFALLNEAHCPSQIFKKMINQH